jgi:hypothetical protein
MFPYLIAGAIGFGIAKLFEYDKSTKYADGGSILLAPNGKPSNLTPEQYKLVRSPEFKAWFGDWENDPENSSKVIDKETKEPLVVYHGSKSNFNEFDKTKIGFNTSNALRGFYFTDNSSVAYSYTYDENEDDYYGDVIEVFLSANKMKIIDAENKDWVEFSETAYIDKKIKKAFESGYDSVMVKNIADPFIDMDNGTDYYGNNFVVDNPNQIKLADGSNTTFDANNPDIRFDGGGVLPDNIFDYLKEKGFEPLGNGLRSKSNCTIKMDFSNVLYQAQNDNRVWISPIEYSDYKKAFTILEFHCRDKNKGIGTAVLEEIIRGADLFGYTIFIEPTSMKKYRVETDINTDDLKRWYSKFDFKPINNNYSNYVWLRSPKNSDIS